jgi:hypothetical protein
MPILARGDRFAAKAFAQAGPRARTIIKVKFEFPSVCTGQGKVYDTCGLQPLYVHLLSVAQHAFDATCVRVRTMHS